MRKTNLFLIGAMKAGTTSLVELLSQFNDIYVPPIKEPHYFVDELPDFYWKPSTFFSIHRYFKNEFPKPLHIANVQSEAQYKKLYSLNEGQRYLLDASTAYLACPGTAEKIFCYNPKSKIIVIIREPYERLVSHFNMRKSLGVEGRSLNSAIEHELDQYFRNKINWYTYIKMSLYKEQIEVYEKTFNDVLMLKFEDLKSDPSAVVNQIAHFLKIQSPENLSIKKTNKTLRLKFSWLMYFLKKTYLLDVLSYLLPKSLKKQLLNFIASDSKNDLIIDEGIKIQLDKIFRVKSI